MIVFGREGKVIFFDMEIFDYEYLLFLEDFEVFVFYMGVKREFVFFVYVERKKVIEEVFWVFGKSFLKYVIEEEFLKFLEKERWYFGYVVCENFCVFVFRDVLKEGDVEVMG